MFIYCTSNTYIYNIIFLEKSKNLLEEDDQIVVVDKNAEKQEGLSRYSASFFRHIISHTFLKSVLLINHYQYNKLSFYRCVSLLLPV